MRKLITYYISLIFFFLLGASFAEALGMCTIQPSRKRQSNISPNPNRSIKVEPPSPPINNKKLPLIKTEPECEESPSVSVHN